MNAGRTADGRGTGLRHRSPVCVLARQLGPICPEEETDRIMEAIVRLLPPEAREKRTPTEEEIRLAKPPDSKQ